MELSGQIRTTCPPDQLVRIMRDPATLAQLLPVGSKMDMTADGSYAFSVTKSVGPIKLTLPGTMQLQPTGQNHDQSLTAHAAHMIGGKVDLALTLTLTTEGRVTILAYAGTLTATGLAGRVLKEHANRANGSLKSALSRLREHAEAQMRKRGARQAQV
jgi:carbon monoxide dehydrogenase subunit G